MIKLGILMDPISRINVRKDTSLAMLLAAQRRGLQSYYLEAKDIWLQEGTIWGNMAQISVQDNAEHWFDLQSPLKQPLANLDVLLMRIDPPFNMDYIYLTYLLEQAQQQGLRVINNPQSLRDANEKLFTLWFPQCCPPTIVTAQMNLLTDFARQEGEIVVKPLDKMGGASIFRVNIQDPNFHVIIETLTDYGKQMVMGQRFIPEIRDGDKRIILINGKPIPYALARIPAADDFRGNLASGATSEGRELTDRDFWLCEQVGPTLQDKGLVFVGLDVIGDYLTEINVTSPTGVRQLDTLFGLDIAGELIDHMISILQS